jgi:hypothetical protein
MPASLIGKTRGPAKKFTVIVSHTVSHDPEQNGEYAVVCIANDAFDAASNAGLAVIWHAQGIAQPIYVFEHGTGLARACDNSVFDADDYAETITFTGVESVEAISYR